MEAEGKMSDAVPMISISAEDGGEPRTPPGEDGDEIPVTDVDSVSGMSDGDVEAENEGDEEASSLVASRLRRKIKKKPRHDSEDGGVTDVETMECDHDGEEDDDDDDAGTDVDPAVIQQVLDAYNPATSSIVDDADGKRQIKSVMRSVVGADVSDLSEVSDEEDAVTMKFQSYRDVATDVESWDDSDVGEDDDAGAAAGDDSPGLTLSDALKHYDLGSDVRATDHQEERQGSPHPPTTSLTLPSRCPARRKTRKSASARSKPKPPPGLLGVAADEDPVTDVEDIDDVGAGSSSRKRGGSGGGRRPGAAAATGSLGLPVDDTAATTDVEDLEDVGTRPPGILIDCPASGDDSDAEFLSGRSSRMELTDVEMDGDGATAAAAAAPLSSSLGLPDDSADPLTDVEEVDNVEEEPLRILIQAPPPACTAQQQVIELMEDEHGVETLVSRKTGPEAEMLLRPDPPEEGGLTDCEDLGVSGDEHDLHDYSPSPIPHEIAGIPESSTVHVTDMEDAPAPDAGTPPAPPPPSPPPSFFSFSLLLLLLLLPLSPQDRQSPAPSLHLLPF